MKKKVFLVLVLFGFVLFGVTERTNVKAYVPIDWEEYEGAGSEIGPECDLCRVTIGGRVRFGCRPAENKMCTASGGGATISCNNAARC